MGGTLAPPSPLPLPNSGGAGTSLTDSGTVAGGVGGVPPCRVAGVFPAVFGGVVAGSSTAGDLHRKK